jgi:hypothetical protein
VAREARRGWPDHQTGDLLVQLNTRWSGRQYFKGARAVSGAKKVAIKVISERAIT